jgi:hypothetical protein
MSVAEYARDSINGTYDDVPLQPWHNTLHYSHGTTRFITAMAQHVISTRCNTIALHTDAARIS